MASTFTPSAAAKAIGCSTDTIRRYCSLYARHLSEGATPAKGKPRILTAEDIFVIKKAKDKTEEGATIEEVDDFLDTIVFQEEDFVEVAGDEAQAIEPDFVETAVAPAGGEEAIELFRRMTTAIERIDARDDRVARLEAEVAQIREAVEPVEPTEEDRLRSMLEAYPTILLLVGIVVVVLIAFAFALGAWLG